VVVELAPSPDDPQVRILTATAEFPRHPIDRVRMPRTLTVTVPPSTPREPEES
jgi:hypothetical protein